MTNSMKYLLLSAALTAVAAPAFAGAPTIPVPEPGLAGIFTGGVLLALALAYRGRKK